MLGRCWVGLQFGLMFALAILCVLRWSKGLPAGVASWLFWLASAGVGLWALSVNRPGVLMAKARMEERWLEQRYPQYAEYRLRTYCLVPLVH